MKYASTLNQHQNISSLQLNIEDLLADDFFEVSNAITNDIVDTNVIVDLAGIEVMTSNEFFRVDQLVRQLTLRGHNVIVCSISITAAIMAVTFDNPIQYRTARDPDHAISLF